MARERKPVVDTNPIAQRYASTYQIERIVEFNSGVPGGPGGLIAFRRLDDGTLRVELYRLDEGVDVVVSPDRDPR